MPNYQEARQFVRFPDNWRVIRLDQHRYYQRISGKGLKAVDFIAVDDDMGLILIELKDYHTDQVPQEDVLEHTANRKLQDSIKVIRIVYQALYRQWYFRWIFLKWKWYRLCPEEWLVWRDAMSCIEEGNYLLLMDICQDKDC